MGGVSTSTAGGEHLASIVAWAIEGTHPTRIGYYDRDHLAEAFEIVTGEQAPTMRGASVVATAPATAIQAVNETVVELPQ